MNRLIGFALALMVSGCGATGSSPTDAPSQASSQSAGAALASADASPEATSIAEPSGSDRLPSGAGEERSVTVAELLAQPEALSVYGGADLIMDVFLASPGMVDCPSSSGLEPAFFHCSHLVLLGTPAGDYPTPDTAVFAVLHPDVEDLRGMAMDQLLTVTAHYDDPAASTCHFNPYEGPAPEPPAAEMVFVCRSTLVITAFDELQP